MVNLGTGVWSSYRDPVSALIKLGFSSTYRGKIGSKKNKHYLSSKIVGMKSEFYHIHQVRCFCDEMLV